MENKHTAEGLAQLQSLPLEAKITLSKKRIKEWYDYWDGEVYVSFSGGKDSTVLKHLVENTVGVYDVPSVFVDTGLEYPEIRKFAMSQPNVITVRSKMRFDEVIKKYGYPVFGKEVAKCIEYGRKAITKGNEEMVQRYLYGKRINPQTGETYTHMPLSKLALDFALNSNIPASAECCTVMKKKRLQKIRQRNGQEIHSRHTCDRK